MGWHFFWVGSYYCMIVQRFTTLPTTTSQPSLQWWLERNAGFLPFRWIPVLWKSSDQAVCHIKESAHAFPLWLIFMHVGKPRAVCPRWSGPHFLSKICVDIAYPSVSQLNMFHNWMSSPSGLFWWRCSVNWLIGNHIPWMAGSRIVASTNIAITLWFSVLPYFLEGFPLMVWNTSVETLEEVRQLKKRWRSWMILTDIVRS